MASRRPDTAAPCLPNRPSEWPKVAVLVSAYNAEKSIRSRIENLANCDYPKDRMTIVVASDGSKDDTVGEAKRSGAP